MLGVREGRDMHKDRLVSLLVCILEGRVLVCRSEVKCVQSATELALNMYEAQSTTSFNMCMIVKGI